MAETGGPTTQSGAFFQNTVAAWYMAKMLHDAGRGPSENRVLQVRCEAPVDVDDVVVRFERGIHYVQVKEALAASGKAWTGLWRHFWREFERIDPDRDRLVLWGGLHTDLFRGLQAMVKRAQSVPPGPLRRQMAEYAGRLTKQQIGWLDGITAIIRDHEAEMAPDQNGGEITRSDVFELLQVMDVVVKGDASEIEEQATNTFLSGMTSTAAVFATLRDLAAEQARVRGAWDPEGLQAALIQRGVSLKTHGMRIEPHTNEGDSGALEQELQLHERNLQILRKQAAVYAEGEKPLRLLNQIAAEEQAISEIGQRLPQ